MNKGEVRAFLEHINEHTEQEIINNLQYIKTYFRMAKYGERSKESIEKMLKIVEKSQLLQELLINDKKFLRRNRKLDIPDNLKYGLEIEVANLPLESIKYMFDTKSIIEIMKILNIPSNIAEQIVRNSDFEKKNEFSKWIFSKEAGMDTSEASSPILKNNIFDLNQIIAICTILKALGGGLHGGTGLHINVGVDYLECNEKAIENLLRIWGECEELFFKMASPEGDVIRVEAADMAIPIKENIQNFFESDGSVTLNTEEDMERFLYQIQARNRLDGIVSWSSMDIGEDLEYQLYYAQTDEEKFDIFHRYNQGIKENQRIDNNVRWTSINFNHMVWNSDNPGRIEIRIFNSSLEPEIIFQDLTLVGKLFEVSLKNAKDSSYKKEEFEKLFSRDVSEHEKVKNLLNLLYDDDQKKIFYKRWESIRNERAYKKYKSGKDTFQR